MDQSLPWRSSQPRPNKARPPVESRKAESPGLAASEWSLPDWTTHGVHSETFRRVKTTLDQGTGYVVLKGFPVSWRTEDELIADFEAFVHVFGTVTLHGESKKPIWRVSPRASLDHVPTFSETASEAPLHTDNSWVPEPEPYFALLVIQPATDGGDSVLFSVEDLKRDFALTPDGAQAIEVLTTNQFPFAMPAVFRGEASPHEVVISSVFGSPLGFRFRYDVIRAGFLARPDLATSENVAAVEAFNSFLLDVLDTTPGVPLERGDVVLAHNHRVLHARTHFTDPNRLLLRARMTDDGSTRP